MFLCDGKSWLGNHVAEHVFDSKKVFMFSTEMSRTSLRTKYAEPPNKTQRERGRGKGT